jgi:alpha-amylase
MKNLILIAVCLFSFTGNSQSKRLKIFPVVSDAMMENAVIYEVNIRQYSSEGTFKAFEKDIPELKKLGIKILWIMPVFPIGLEKRKEGLGSYYSVKDYKAINPEFGNLDDYKKLVATAHQNGIYVIQDWVANHTAWDHSWVKENPDYYTKDKDGKMISPFDWTDVVKLNYDNQNMRKAMISEMNFWLKNANIDGFRCDVAMEVPKDFWENAKTELSKIKPVFMLMEAEQPNLMENAFDMQYAWDEHHIMNEVAQGKKTVKDLDTYYANRKVKYAKDDIDMHFTSNHDENSWNGTEYERLGDAVEIFAVLTYLTPGMPLIYNGQEYDFNKRLKFFVKDEITKNKGKMFAVYEKLGKLKNNNIALNGGKKPATYKRIVTNEDEKILVFEREKSGKKIILIANLSNKTVQTKIGIKGKFIEFMSGNKIDFYSKDAPMGLKAWQYLILIPE